MSAFVELRNVSDLGDLVVVLDGEPVHVDAGATIQVSPEQAGEPPFWRPVEKGEPRDPLSEYRGDGSPDSPPEVRELGSGLLAQLGNWELATAASAKGGN